MFTTTYHEARWAFREHARAKGAELLSVPIEARGQRAADGSQLSIDVAFLGQGPRGLVLSSGLHGVEGYAGSATQRFLLDSALPEDRRIVLIHAINPAGMAGFRRVNERNVDLNRNFLPAGEAYEGSPSHYARLNGLLNPTHEPSSLEFFARAGWQIMRYGYAPLKQAIAGGQYDFSTGLFWGGDQLEEGPRQLLEILPEIVSGMDEITWIDLHTGLGPRGSATYLVEAPLDSAVYRSLADRFGDRVQAWDQEGGVAYRIRGGFPTALAQHLGDRLAMLTCEYGTISSLAVLRALVDENYRYHHGGDASLGKAAMRRAFYPEDQRWQHDVLASAATLIQAALA